MNGAHDMGGMHGMGPIDTDPNDPLFHAEWERRAFAVTLALGFHGRWNIDTSRHARENRHPLDYLGSSYFELWFKAVEKLALDTGLMTADEVATGTPAALADTPPPNPERVAAILRKGVSAKLPDTVPPRFQVGARVLVREVTTPRHTRVPRYCRGRTGVIDRDHGVYVFPDTHAHGEGVKPQHCYSVRFTGQELWGDTAPARDAIYIDLWDDYLEPAP
ncbi:low-molecular weight cobalt-containing nitrile hydratase subunit beta [Skermanella stibiiresistens SB22]|uniref:Nitrile hydratase subunit beta n=1 Tax=Skermanella stibiiresistens SB22 TaxID=1385369 RepID=W9GZW2_9PROT|nr:nitrile hydratase subunit beta [Skermanella stibiiresistens]EWY39349.1 low-molecular weight cobalt-containing nitrile hydratase subunit beta [Skermanella stibiiresistens SB22]